MKFISLFSGAMGLDLGLEMAGFEPGVCVENDKEAIKTIKHNRPDLPFFDCSIVDVNGNELKKAAKFGRSRVPLVAGGPPCQAFSVFGNRLGIEDARGQLVFEFMRIVEETQPTTFLMENVRGLLSMSFAPNKKELKEDNTIPKEYFEKEKLSVLIDGAGNNELAGRAPSYDIILSNTMVTIDTDKPVFNAIPLLTGIGEKELVAEVIAKVREVIKQKEAE